MTLRLTNYDAVFLAAAGVLVEDPVGGADRDAERFLEHIKVQIESMVRRGFRVEGFRIRAPEQVGGRTFRLVEVDLHGSPSLTWYEAYGS